MPQIFIEEKDDCVYNFENFELCLSNLGHYILSKQGYFEFKTLDDFVMIKGCYRIVDEDGGFDDVSKKDFDEIKKLYEDYNNVK